MAGQFPRREAAVISTTSDAAMNGNISGKVVVITGASSGLGEATARYLVERGATVALGARRAERLQALVGEITGKGGQAFAFATDVTDAAQVQRLVDAAVERFGRIDVMLNNAGLMAHSPLERRKIADWNQMIDVHIKGVLYGIAAALPHMQRQKSGHIINVSSVAGHKVGVNNAVYAATKTAVRVLSEGLRQEVKPWNLRTTIISPGAIATDCPAQSRPKASPTTSRASTSRTPSRPTASRAGGAAVRSFPDNDTADGASVGKPPPTCINSTPAPAGGASVAK